MWAKLLFESCLDLLFPPRCAVCSGKLNFRGGSIICMECLGNICFVKEPVCSVCGMEVYATVGTNTICGDCLRKRPPFESARSLCRYGNEVRVLISTLKYKKDTSVVAALNQLVRMCDLSLYKSCDLVVPVPLHTKRLRLRGFNQALLLARVFFGTKDRRIKTTVLQRIRNTVPQVTLDGKERRRSLRNVFRVDPAVDMKGLTICLVDDVYTTGTTVSECSRALLRGGAEKVVVLTLARVEVPRRGRHAR